MKFKLVESITLHEAPINGDGSLINYNKEIKTLLSNVENLIRSGSSYDGVYKLILNNMMEDIDFKARFYARHGISWRTVLDYYQKCIDAFATAYPTRTVEKSDLDTKLVNIRNIITATPSCKV